MKKVYTERYSILNSIKVLEFIKLHFDKVVEHQQNGMTYLKLDGKEENHTKLQKLIADGKRS